MFGAFDTLRGTAHTIRAFLGQCPLLLLSIVLVWWKLEEPQHGSETNQSIWTRLKRIDFVGALFMSAAILAGITALDLAGKQTGHESSLLTVLIIIAFVAAILFALAEKFWAKEPIFPLNLLGHQAVISSYLILFIQTGIQVAVSTNR